MAGEAKRALDGGALPVLPPRFALVELAVFAAIIAIELVWEPFPDLSKLNPHPYWIAVLLLSLQYGTVSGLLAAALAIAGSWLIGLAELEIGESYFSYLIRVWTQPVLWVVVALLLGSFRMRQIEERFDLLRLVDESTLHSGALTGYATELKARVETLERRLATGAKPETERLLDALGALAASGSGQRPERWEAHVHAALDLAFPEAKASLFVAEPDGLRLVLAHRWPDGVRWRRDIAQAEPLAQAILTEARAVSILAAGDERVLAGDGLFAVPLVGADTSQVIGMLRLEHLPASALSPTTAARLQAFARHLVPATGGATSHQDQTNGAHPSLGQPPTVTPTSSLRPTPSRFAAIRRWRPNGGALNGRAGDHAAAPAATSSAPHRDATGSATSMLTAAVSPVISDVTN
jgi:GAF domain